MGFVLYMYRLGGEGEPWGLRLRADKLVLWDFKILRLRRLVQLHQRNFCVKQPGGVVLLKNIIIHDNHSVLLAFTMTLLSAAMMPLLVPHANMAQQCRARVRKNKKLNILTTYHIQSTLEGRGPLSRVWVSY